MDRVECSRGRLLQRAGGDQRADMGSVNAPTCADAIEQLGSRDLERCCELGDRPNARLALAALDLGDVRSVEACIVCETFLAEPTLATEATQVGSEDIERVGHGPTMLRHLSQ
jgi:hypothetical protein